MIGKVAGTRHMVIGVIGVIGEGRLYANHYTEYALR